MLVGRWIAARLRWTRPQVDGARRTGLVCWFRLARVGGGSVHRESGAAARIVWAELVILRQAAAAIFRVEAWRAV